MNSTRSLWGYCWSKFKVKSDDIVLKVNNEIVWDGLELANHFNDCFIQNFIEDG